MTDYATSYEEYVDEDKPLAPLKKGDEYEAEMDSYRVTVRNQRGEVVDIYEEYDLLNVVVGLTEQQLKRKRKKVRK